MEYEKGHEVCYYLKKGEGGMAQIKLDEIDEIARQMRREFRMNKDRIKKNARQWQQDYYDHKEEYDDERANYCR